MGCLPGLDPVGRLPRDELCHEPGGDGGSSELFEQEGLSEGCSVRECVSKGNLLQMRVKAMGVGRYLELI